MDNSDTNLEKASDLSLNEDKEVPFSEIAKRRYNTNFAKKNMRKVYININGKTTADDGEFARFQRKYHKEFVDEFNDWITTDGIKSIYMLEIFATTAAYIYVARTEHTKKDAFEETIKSYRDMIYSIKELKKEGFERTTDDYQEINKDDLQKFIIEAIENSNTNKTVFEIDDVVKDDITSFYNH